VLLGVETNPQLRRSHGQLIDVLERVILGIFVIEIALRLLAHAPRIAKFFKDPWNVFDFAVVAIATLPAVGTMAMVARLARVLRVVRLLSFSRQLRLIVDTLLRSIPSMGHVVLLLAILIYTYSVLGIALFRDPRGASLEQMEQEIHQAAVGSEERDALEQERDRVKANDLRWGHLGRAAWSMFQTLTFENWVGLQDPLMERYWFTPSAPSPTPPILTPSSWSISRGSRTSSPVSKTPCTGCATRHRPSGPTFPNIRPPRRPATALPLDPAPRREAPRRHQQRIPTLACGLADLRDRIR
jgi:hypothetical protein